ncbi:MAG: glutamate mutase L [Anaerolineaceae bacterium]
MSTSSYLSIDISSMNTRAWLFNDQPGIYRLAAYSVTPTFLDSGSGLTAAIKRVISEVERKTDTELLFASGKFNIETTHDIPGLRGVGLTTSIGRPIRVVLVGISEKYSMEPLRRLARFYNTEIVLEINLQNEPNIAIQLEKLTNTAFDLLILAGGVDGGPEMALRAMIGNLRLLVQLRGATNRPQIVYIGNQALADYTKMEIDAGGDLHIGGNIQPESGREDLSFASVAIREAIFQLRMKEFPELQELVSQPKVSFLPAEFARARMGHWLEQTQTNGKSVLQVHLEPDFAHVIAIKEGGRMGVWQNCVVDDETVDAVLAQSDQPVQREIAAAYLANRTLHPDYMPMTIEETSLELVWMCVRIRNLLKEMALLHDDFNYDDRLGLIDYFEPILLSGSSFKRLPSARHAFIVTQDAILPHGITTLVDDNYQVLTPLGVITNFDPLLVTQVIDSNIFNGLATIVNVDSPIAAGEKVLGLEMDEGYGGAREHYQVYQSELKRFETVPGSDLRVYLSPEPDSDIGMGLRGLGGWLNADASDLDLVVDARGRPLFLPADEQARRDLRRDWLWNLGA